MKKVLLFVYDTFAEFEISILATCLSSTEFSLITFSQKEKGTPIKSEGKFNIVADRTLEEVNPIEYEALIIPGGTPSYLLNDERLINIVRAFYRENKLIAAICGGPVLLGVAGILDEVKYTSSITMSDDEYKDYMNWTNAQEQVLVKDQNIITSTGSNYVAFAEEVLRSLGCISADEKDPLLYFRVPSMG
ncbi:DJ-1/PfpI family protein [Bacillus salitolerans]|uniref:DJ-1/PfpI family protein n=1 Tax=Bacillus salitolerans TaxID=1437434 RepID=A0ABW4LYY5_9BACI